MVLFNLVKKVDLSLKVYSLKKIDERSEALPLSPKVGRATLPKVGKATLLFLG
jgi:hypothetical protein